MENNSSIKSADEAAAYWTARLMSGSMSSEERQAFEHWRSQSEENRRALEDVDVALAAIDASAAELLADEFERELNEEAGKPRLRKPKFGVGAFGAIAASLFLIAVAGVIALNVDRFLSSDQSYVTAIGELRQVDLADGSQVELDTDTVLNIAFNRRARDVRLAQGQALFNVERDASRPFVVETLHGEFVAVGTVFNISTFTKKSVINVVSGSVEASSSDGSLTTLLAGDSLVLGSQGVIGGVEKFDPNYSLAWRKGKARFRDAPLEEVVGVLNRYFETPVLVDDESTARLPVTGEFDLKDQATAVEALRVAFDLSVERSQDGVRLTSSSPARE